MDTTDKSFITPGLDPDRTVRQFKRRIDVEAFWDRFNTAQRQRLRESADPAVKAFVADVEARRWIRLGAPWVAAGMDAAIAANLVGFNAALRAAVIDADATLDENIVYRNSIVE